MKTLKRLKIDDALKQLTFVTIPDNDRRRLKHGVDRRRFSYTAYSPDRRSGYDRRRIDLSVPQIY